MDIRQIKAKTLANSWQINTKQEQLNQLAGRCMKSRIQITRIAQLTRLMISLILFAAQGIISYR